ncbi:MAG: CDP-diacylglycerol--glycerol-3-phosphate 3-phosphatidyltransferase [Bdellovibrionales bacterium]|nr:CDP-diacylglycerol--glycerol-3-phosphate 3-phosphatidyltransferase [Bdellovibrionales bacterium]
MRQHLPNAITLSRLVGIPVLLLWMHFAESDEFLPIALFFLFLAGTDALDGYLARRLDVVSDFGKLLDPLVDKILIVAPLVTLVGFRSEVTGDPWVPSVMVNVLIAREFWVTGVRGVAASRGIVVAASDLGKLKTVFQVAAVFFLFLHDQKLFQIGEAWVTGQYFGLQCLITAIVIAYWSGIEYTLLVFRGMRGSFHQDSSL